MYQLNLVCNMKGEETKIILVSDENIDNTIYRGRAELLKYVEAGWIYNEENHTLTDGERVLHFETEEV